MFGRIRVLTRHMDIKTRYGSKEEVGVRLLKRGRSNRIARDRFFALVGKSYTLVMSCGIVYKFKTASDIPEVDTRCACGDPGHWVVKYE